MNNFSRTLGLSLAAVALTLAGCATKQPRPNPNDTMMGPGGGDMSGLNPTPVPFSEPGSGLTIRHDGITETDDMIMGMFEPVLFDLDKSDIKPTERQKLIAAKDYIARFPGYRIRFEGHADWRGTAEYNLALGDRRAAAAKAYVTTSGLAADKSEIISKGSLDAKKNGDEATMAKDRNVTIIILKK